VVRLLTVGVDDSGTELCARTVGARHTVGLLQGRVVVVLLSLPVGSIDVLSGAVTGQ
jgi:hypothetical protein